MEGALFYWFCWMFWIGVYFFMEKGKKRTTYSILILFLLIFASLEIEVFGHSISVGFIFCLLIGYVLLTTVRLRSQLYFLVVSLIVAFAGISFQLFEIFDPVIILFDRSWMLGLLYAALVLALVSNRKKRVPVFIVGACQGELVMTNFLQTIYVEQTIGHLQFFDALFVTLFLLILWYFLEVFTEMVSKKVLEKSQREVGV
ncbi:hypothetical protein [Alkalihalobacillus sp. LMS39]|uniref:YphA family membrane protein n=1 Tax=Alkalihalobacillus sp. LMS39 TaxID=2924032 RepID=UPI001FB46734|nr:hypothetical protein [Alkalihalobacillus sp. LMS39]UOE92356.1 hypothetical protein MM271_13975 [Alkalihalobacillus sp. LMS39]